MKTQRKASLLPLVLAAFAFTLSLAVSVQAQTLTTVVNLDIKRGADPTSPVIQGFDGNLYGTAISYGTSAGGTAFRITPAGGFAPFYNYCGGGTCPSSPNGGLIQAPNGRFYGTSIGGGTTGQGTVYELTPEGTETTLYTFSISDGSFPYGTLLLATDGYFYGTTEHGGANSYGTVFKITASGTLTTLHSFDNIDGDAPQGALIEFNGEFYGTTPNGGAFSSGTAFKITRSGTVTTLHSFDGGADGGQPFAGLTLGSDGNLYGTTINGGANRVGTVFKMTPSGKVTTLHDFVDSTDGNFTLGALIQANDGNFYGTNEEGGNPSCTNNGPGCGTIFEITPAGVFTTLHMFDGTDGSYPYSGLFQATDGTFYGSTWYGGTVNRGIIYTLNTELPAFVQPRPTSGRVGTSVTILGNGLTGATSVTFNGAPATFTVISSTEIKTTIPLGATTGAIQVVTSGGGTLNSNPAFQIVP